MARPSKTLQARVAERKFKAREHAGLLAGPLVAAEELRRLQQAWQAAGSDAVRRAVALEFEKALRDVVPVDQSPAAVQAGVAIGEFFAQNFAHTKGPAAGQPFRLEPWQGRFVDAFERRDEEGLRMFKRGLLGIARGNGKSPLAAGLALRELVVRADSPDVLLGAAAKDQADVVFRYARGFVETGPLADVLRVGRHEIVNPANEGVLRKVSADGYLQHGLNPSAVVLDELWAFRTDKQRELFDAVDSAIHKRPDAYWLAISTAGQDRLTLLGRLHGELLELGAETADGLTVVEDDAGGVLMHWYGAAADADFDDESLWEAVNPASFVTVEALRRQRQSPSMSRSTFGRLHANAWIAAEIDRWIPGGAWDGLADEQLAVPEGATIWVGADGSRSYDTTAVAWAWHATDDRVGVDARIFSVRPDVPHHVEHTGTIDFADVEGFLLELASRYRVAEVRFDPRFLERSMDVLAGRLPGAAVAPVEPYSGAHRLALQAFERAVLDGSLTHRGDRAVSEQIAWAGVDRFDNGDVRRIRKLDRTRPIDAAVACSLAIHGATLTSGGSCYEERGLAVVV